MPNRNPRAQFIIFSTLSIISLSIFGTLSILQPQLPPPTPSEGTILPDTSTIPESPINTPLVPPTPTQPKPPEPPPEPLPPQPIKSVYLTIDDGPTSHTQKILELELKYNISATHFVTGTFPKYARYLTDIAGHGDRLCLHSNSHRYADIYRSDDAFFADLAAINRLVEKHTGITTKCLRFPGGGSNTVSRRYSKGIMTRLATKVQEQGYRYYDWNCDLGDSNPKTTADQVFKEAKKCMRNGKDPLVILAHDTKVTAEALDRIIPLYLEAGYTFLSIDENTPEIHHKIVN